MGTYIIIGGDGKEYGPITEADIRQWIAEGRLNGQSLAKAVSDAEFRPLEKFPELAGLWSGGTPSTITALPAGGIPDGDYEIDIGGCVSQGFELLKKHFGMLFACVLVFIVIKIALASVINFTVVATLTKLFPSAVTTVAVGFLLTALNAPVMGPLQGGVFLIVLKLIRGEAAGIVDLFTGFQKNWAQLFLGSLTVDLINVACMAPASYVIAVKINPLVQQLQAMQSHGGAPQEMGKVVSQMLGAYTSSFPILFLCLIPMTYLAVTWQFTIALIIDKNLSFGEAMKAGWQRVNMHWMQVFGLSVVAGLIGLAGLLGCGIGILFTAPVTFVILMFGYETIFSAKNP